MIIIVLKLLDVHIFIMLINVEMPTIVLSECPDQYDQMFIIPFSIMGSFFRKAQTFSV